VLEPGADSLSKRRRTKMAKSASNPFLAIFVLLTGALGLFGVVLPLLIIIDAYVLQILWGWFVVTTFAAPALSIPQAIGLSLVVNFFKHSVATHKPSGTKKSSLSFFGEVLFYPVLALIIGKIVTMFM
jgi:hypothetical protein